MSNKCERVTELELFKKNAEYRERLGFEQIAELEDEIIRLTAELETTTALNVRSAKDNELLQAMQASMETRITELETENDRLAAIIRNDLHSKLESHKNEMAILQRRIDTFYQMGQGLELKVKQLTAALRPFSDAYNKAMDSIDRNTNAGCPPCAFTDRDDFKLAFNVLLPAPMVLNRHRRFYGKCDM